MVLMYKIVTFPIPLNDPEMNLPSDEEGKDELLLVKLLLLNL
jgi:hypothetical protein